MWRPGTTAREMAGALTNLERLRAASTPASWVEALVLRLVERVEERLSGEVEVDVEGEG